MNKKVKQIIPVFDLDMGGIMVKQALPTNSVSQVDPFLLLHHGSFKFTDRSPAIHQGIGPHPHRGFTPVTFVIEGEVHHRDSRGNNQVAQKGEVQWMHAGAGIIHSERPSQELAERKGRQEVIQLWINSPADKKMIVPKYQYIAKENIPMFFSGDKKISNKLIAGEYNGLYGKIRTESDLLIIWSNANAGGSQSFEMPQGFNAMLYVVRGDLRITGFGKVEGQNLVVLEELGESIEVSAEMETEFLILTGAPINEKVVQQGPFVMNTETQIMEAMRDYQMGKMGVLIEEK